jgi:hypothetical protein
MRVRSAAPPRPGIGLEVNDAVARRFVRPSTLYYGERP